MRFGRRLAYRVWQFWKLISSQPLSDDERTIIEELLDAQQFSLFSRQNSAGQQHAFRVYQRLREAGNENRELLIAALLHDVGKIRYQNYWWDRPIVVVMSKIFPTKTTEWGNQNSGRWRRPFIVKGQHAKWGASYAEEVGCSALTINLIRYHQDPDVVSRSQAENQMLRQLIWADSQS